MRRQTLPFARCLTIGVVLIAQAGCYPGGVSTYEETDTVVAVKNPDADFSANRTFSLPDQVVDLCDLVQNIPPPATVTDPVDCSDSEQINHSFDALTLQTVRDNMIQLGYVEELDPGTNQPDVGVFVAAARNRWYVQYYYDYWYWYWGWYPGWTGYSEFNWYYPGVPVVAVYDTGTLLITIVKSEDTSSADQRLPVLWNGVVNGLLGSSVATTQARIEDGINKAFALSPYLSVQ